MSFLNFSKIFISLNFLILSINVFSMESENPDRISEGKQEVSYLNHREQESDEFSPEIIDFIEKVSSPCSDDEIVAAFQNISLSNKKAALEIAFSGGRNIFSKPDLFKSVKTVKFRHETKEYDGSGLSLKREYKFDLSYIDNILDQDKILYVFNSHFDLLKNKPRELSKYLYSLYCYNSENGFIVKIFKFFYEQLPDSEKAIFKQAVIDARLPIRDILFEESVESKAPVQNRTSQGLFNITENN